MAHDDFLVPATPATSLIAFPNGFVSLDFKLSYFQSYGPFLSLSICPIFEPFDGKS